MPSAADLPDDIDALKAMLVASEARNLRKDARIERLEKLVVAFKQTAFGRKSEKSDPDAPSAANQILCSGSVGIAVLQP